MSEHLAALRRFYADEICAITGVESELLRAALARVHRERFLGKGPWHVSRATTGYRVTRDADPAHLYHNLVVAIDPARKLNNAAPSAVAIWLGALDVGVGDRVVHIGCGVGYYTAILAEMVGPTGSVVGYEVDGGLAARASENLEPWRWATAIHGDAAEVPPCDRLLVNAGCTAPRASWVDAIGVDGVLVLPLTATRGPGAMVAIRAAQRGYAIEHVTRVGIYDCAGARDDAESAAIARLLAGTGHFPASQLVRARHPEGPACLLHTRAGCFQG